MSRKPMRAPQIIRQQAKVLRQESTPAEAVLWDKLRGRRLNGLKFRRQHPIDRFIVDFYCAQARLIVEIDGGIHARQREHDQEREALLTAHGYRLIRFTNEAVWHDIEQVLQQITEAAKGT